jgi:hypothetical protein
MKLLRFSYNSHCTKRYPWIFSLRFLDALLPKRLCSSCLRQLRYSFQGPMRAFAEGGSSWPDILNGESHGPHVLVSERVKNALTDLGATGASFGPIRLGRAEGRLYGSRCGGSSLPSPDIGTWK